MAIRHLRQLILLINLKIPYRSFPREASAFTPSCQTWFWLVSTWACYMLSLPFNQWVPFSSRRSFSVVQEWTEPFSPRETLQQCRWVSPFFLVPIVILVIFISLVSIHVISLLVRCPLFFTILYFYKSAHQEF